MIKYKVRVVDFPDLNEDFTEYEQATIYSKTQRLRGYATHIESVIIE